MPWTVDELNSLWSALPASPSERGRIEQVCIRPDVGQREFPEEIELCPHRGALGDRWVHRTWLYLPDGSPDPRVQVAIMNSGTLRFLQSLTGCQHHPGDTLIANLDLGFAHLPVGAKLEAGGATLEVSDVENDACTKFATHYGPDVFRWIRDPANRSRRHRGLFARVVNGGKVRAGDIISRIAS